MFLRRITDEAPHIAILTQFERTELSNASIRLNEALFELESNGFCLCLVFVKLDDKLADIFFTLARLEQICDQGVIFQCWINLTPLYLNDLRSGKLTKPERNR